MSIPAKEYLTWKIPSDAKDVYPDIESEEMIDLLLIKFLIRKNEDDLDYASIRAKAPVRIDFGELFYHTTKNYNDKYDKDLIQLKDDNGQNYNWVFFFESKWYQSTKYIDPEHSLGSNLVTENSVIICERRKEAKLPTSKKKKNEDIQEVLLLEGSASSEGKTDNINKSIK